MNFLYQNPKLKKLRQNLRRRQTDCEHRLWQVLRKNQILGHKFIRQYGVGKYILDFYCPKLRLAIELDGSQHMKEKQKNYDETRTKFLKKQNISILRFHDNDIFRNLEGIIDRLGQFIKQINIPS